jgi:ribose 5-phosphate isomerase B
MKSPAVALGSDHAGYVLKEEVKKILETLGVEYVDLGTYDEESTDYPDYAAAVAKEVQRGSRGILCCGTGVGMSIAANKFKGIRAAVCNDPLVAELSRRHNDANVLAMGGRIISDQQVARQIVATWLQTPFEGGRHQRRIDKIKELEKL